MISMNFVDKIKHIKTKSLQGHYPLPFVVDSIIRNFQSTRDVENSFIIPPSLLHKDRPFLLVDIPFCKKKINK